MKLMKIVSISFCIIILLSQSIFAIDDWITTGEKFMEAGKDRAGIGIYTGDLRNASTQIYNILLAIATFVAVVVGAILGIRYMTAGIDRKVEVKESLLPYLISCVVVFGSLGIWKAVVVILGVIR